MQKKILSLPNRASSLYISFSESDPSDVISPTGVTRTRMLNEESVSPTLKFDRLRELKTRDVASLRPSGIVQLLEGEAEKEKSPKGRQNFKKQIRTIIYRLGFKTDSILTTGNGSGISAEEAKELKSAAARNAFISDAPSSTQNFKGGFRAFLNRIQTAQMNAFNDQNLRRRPDMKEILKTNRGDLTKIDGATLDRIGNAIEGGLSERYSSILNLMMFFKYAGF